MTRSISVLIWIYTGSLAIWYFARTFIGDQFFPVLFMNFLGVWLFFPLVILGIWALILKKKPEIYLLIIPLVLFLVFYGPFLIPRQASAFSPGSFVKVMTFNMRYPNTNHEALKEVLKSTDADVLALQEVTKTNEELLVAALAEDYAYHVYDETVELAIYSRYPIQEQEIPSSTNWAVQRVIIQAQKKPFHLINAHLARSGVLQFLVTWNANLLGELTATRNDQIRWINQVISETGLPAIVACDCNMTNLNPSYSEITTNLHDAFKEHGRGLGHTFLIPRGFEIPSKINLPFQRIDYLFYSPNIRLHQVNLITRESGSDHYPVWGLFDIGER